MRLRHKLLIHAFRIGDQIALILALFLAISFLAKEPVAKAFNGLLHGPYTPGAVVGSLLLVAAWFAIFGGVVNYNANRFTTFVSTLQSVLKATTLAAFALLVISAVFELPQVSRRAVLLQWVLATVLISAGRIILRWFLTRLRRSGHNCRNVVFVGWNEHAGKLAESIERQPELGYRIVGFVILDDDVVPDGKDLEGRWPVVARLGGLQSYLEKGVVDEVMVCLPVQERVQEIFDLIQLSHELGVVIRVMPYKFRLSVLERAQVEVFEGERMMTFFRENLLWQLLAKRILDVLVSATMLLVLAPLWLVIAALIKLTSPGPVFFAQERMGMNRRKFQLYKFRSMYVDAEARKKELAALNEMEGPVFKIRNDPRVTKIGKLLRKTSLDEIPQLWNVLKGEMSLVGPRPPLPNEVDQYEWLQHRRLSIKPGLTCLWQVGGRNNLSFAQWMELDREYCENWSIWLDLRILFKTVPVVLLGKGAS